MPRKTKKSAEDEAAELQNSAATPDETQIPEETTAEPAAAAPARKKAPAKKAARKNKVSEQTEQELIEATTADLAGGEDEAVAQAADTFDLAFEANDAAELHMLGTDAEPPAAEAAEPAEEPEEEPEDESEEESKHPGPPRKLERLQKILAAAGVASRRHAEELIAEGRVQVNGKVVTELGTKADLARDHIRVDGKLLHGAERLRYFVLNKPKGYVTTVSDPEGRPTVMEFFSKTGERLYPVGRLDYLSEGLLLVTNDGELANKLTRASSGVEKTYLVKVSGQPAEEDIEALQEGVRIDRGKPGEGRVRTAPARIRQVRQGENPWYEVVLIEGRNRELRKMFEEIGHHVEKIRRVGYGPLVLDQEPGQMRELEAEELRVLRLAADGKWKPRRMKTSGMLPKEAGRTVDLDAEKRRGGKPFRRDEKRPPQGPGPSRAGTGDRNRDRSQGRGFGAGPARRPQGEERSGFGRPEVVGDRGSDRAGDRGGFAARGGQRAGEGQAGAARGGERAGFAVRGGQRPGFAGRAGERSAERGGFAARGGERAGQGRAGAGRGGERTSDRGGFAARGGQRAGFAGRGGERKPEREGFAGRGGERAGEGQAGAGRGGERASGRGSFAARGGQRAGFAGRGGARSAERGGFAGRAGDRGGQRPYRAEAGERPRFGRQDDASTPRRIEGQRPFEERKPFRPRDEQAGGGRGFGRKSTGPVRREFGQDRGRAGQAQPRPGASEERRGAQDSTRPPAAGKGFSRGNGVSRTGSNRGGKPRSGSQGGGRSGGGSNFRGKPGGGKRPGNSGRPRG